MRLFLVATVLVSSVLVSGVSAAEILMIDDFEYPDAAAAGQAWRPGEGSRPVDLLSRQTVTGATALRMPCPFSEEPGNDRVFYDRQVDLDLVRFGTIVFDFYADDPAPIRAGHIYFRAQTGWYGAGFPAERGWNRIRLGKAAFRTEGDPAGWDRIDAIRIAAWKTRPIDTFCAIDNLHVRSERLVIVSGREDGPEAGTARDVAERVGNLLDAAGVPHGIHSSRDVIAGALDGRSLAIFPYNPGMGDDEAQQVRSFLAGGGRAIFFYTIRNDIAQLLGVADTSYRSGAHPGAFEEVVFDTQTVAGLPAAIHQGSWNITAARPGGQDARVIGWWRDAEGARGAPAVILSGRGAFMGHILTGDDLPSKQSFLLALVGHFEPSAWQDAAQHAASGAVRIGPFADVAELEAFLEQRGPQTARPARIAAQLEQAKAMQAEMRTMLAAGRHPEAIAKSQAVRTALSDAYVVSHRPRDGEFRAVWNHSGTGDLDTWDEAMRRLAEANFNAVVPNMWWGGIAHYASDLLPRSRTFEQRGDQIAQAVESGRKYGIEVHPWKVNYNLGRAPAVFVERLRKQGRLQSTSGGEELLWLCPSHPDNQRLEINTMVEVARNYDVHGVHFDYIRYPHEDSCYCTGCRERFETHRGHPVENWPRDCHRGPLRQPYRDWRCEQINIVVRDTAEQVRSIKPHAKISAAVFSGYPGTKNSIGQDWLLWCREGWLDFVCPMNYATSDSSFRSMAAAQIEHLQSVVPLYTGIGHWRITDEQALGQVEIARSLGADGFVLFNMGAALAEQGLPKFAQGITSEPAVLPHNAPLVRFSAAGEDDQPVEDIDADHLAMDTTLVSLGAHGKQPTGVTGVVQLEDMQGERLARLADLPQVAQTVAVTIPRQPTMFRVAAVGQFAFADGTTQRFVLRSRPYRFTGPR